MATTGNLSSANLLAQEAALALPRFELADALSLGALATELATDRGLPVVIVVAHGVREVFRAALPGTTPDNDDWLARKRRVVERFEASTLALRVTYEERGTDFPTATGLSELEYAAHGGGWPIRVQGVGVAGFLGVSGLPQLEDHAFIVEVLGRFLAD